MAVFDGWSIKKWVLDGTCTCPWLCWITRGYRKPLSLPMILFPWFYVTGRPTATTKQWLRDFLHWLSTFPFAHEARSLCWKGEEMIHLLLFFMNKQFPYSTYITDSDRFPPFFSPCQGCFSAEAACSTWSFRIAWTSSHPSPWCHPRRPKFRGINIIEHPNMTILIHSGHMLIISYYIHHIYIYI